MPEEQKTVDIDTSGPDTEVELTSEDQSTESTATEQVEDTSTEAVATPPLDASDSQQEASDEKKDEKKEELEDYSQGVQRRIAKLTKKWREAERQRDEALSFAQLQKKKAEELNKKYSTLESTSVKDRQEKIQSLLDAQKSKLAQARDAGDTNAEVEINKTIAQLGYEDARIQELLKAAESQPKEETVEQPQYPRSEPQQTVDPKAEAWAAQNAWFGKDKAMTYTAFDLHKTLVDEEGYDPKSDEYYTEINKRLRVEFPHKFDKPESTESTKPVQTVASATRSTKTSRKTVRLTPSQVAIAKKLGVPLEEYAKQLKLTKEV